MSQRRVFRRIILPSAWLVIGALIAVSLVKLAFTGSSVADDRLLPTGEVPAESIMAEMGTVDNTLSISGSIKLDEPQQLNAPIDGVVNWAFVKPGDQVSTGDRIFQIRAASQPEALAPAGPEREPSVADNPQRATEPAVTYHDVYAPTTGKVGKFAIELNDEITKGSALATVQPQNFKAVGTISPLDRYRLMDGTLEAEITIDGGPEPFTCKGLNVGDVAMDTVDSASPDQDSDPWANQMSAEGQPENASGSEISCDVPKGIVVFDGLSMRMAIDAGSAEQVLTVPVTAVRGLVGQGAVWRLNENGEQIRTAVELGVTDGKIIEVKSGLDAGAEVLRYVPGTNPVPDDGQGMEIYP